MGERSSESHWAKKKIARELERERGNRGKKVMEEEKEGWVRRISKQEAQDSER